ncbi:MAG: NADH-quinone oxidoreductase subunit L, partial [Actinomycetota bacterium]
MIDLAWLIPVLPLAGAGVNLFFGRRLNRAAGPVASALVAAGFVVGVVVLLDLLAFPAEERAHALGLFDWISAGNFELRAGILVDPLSMTMVLVVTGVGALIHVYAIGYMEHDPRPDRFFAYLN